MKSKKKNCLRIVANGVCVLIIVAAAGIAVASAQVQALRYVYVTADGGSDSNPCSRTAPCRQISKGLQMVLEGGTVFVIGSGEYSKFNIDKSVSIIAAPGITAVVTGANYSSAISIDGSMKMIALRGLTIDANFSYGTGLQMNQSDNFLRVEDCMIHSNTNGLVVSNSGEIFVKNTRFFGGIKSLEFWTNSGSINASVENCYFENGSVHVGRAARVTVSKSSSSSSGFYVSQTGSRLFVEDCRINDSRENGVLITDSGSARISNTVITNSNGYGIRNDGGAARSFGNNRISNNKSGDTYGTILQISLQ